MKNIVHFALASAVCFLMLNSLGFAQEEGHIYVVTTLKMVVPKGGTAAERDSLLLELIEAQKSLEKIHSVLLVHCYIVLVCISTNSIAT